ncbi:unnamed protein product [Cyprideis torosa]|uniref:shikimate dehydrogenase (NADP(+)) n=1 Tax=Cyprideis torosa TaxID=163714 RepID=A0A7R8X0R5_9CRUS|nr:unnamed protein product [Cyprideis torosa]CAG0909961.1 unnamed protein product [Cyprideis torosa]
MHNAAFAHLGIDSVYLPFPVYDLAAAIQGIRGLNICGASVTIPHKERVLSMLDMVDEQARRIGAVNTIVLQAPAEEGGAGRLHGYNTDMLGAILPLEEKIGLSGIRVCLLGAGGAARAIGFGLMGRGAQVVLCSRTAKRGRALAEELGCPWLPLHEADQLQGEVLVNATSVGMSPLQEKIPVRKEMVARFKVVMDIIYTPSPTILLKEAKAAGCTVIGGLEMLLYQGVAQFELWTGREAPVALMRQALQEASEKRANL